MYICTLRSCGGVSVPVLRDLRGGGGDQPAQEHGGFHSAVADAGLRGRVHRLFRPAVHVHLARHADRRRVCAVVGHRYGRHRFHRGAVPRLPDHGGEDRRRRADRHRRPHAEHGRRTLTAPPERRPRDPAGRRQAIIDAAGRVIARRGLAGLTHRRVAAEADVPVGSTTYYFSDLGALREAALAHAATSTTDYLERWRREIDEAGDLPATLARLITAYLAESDRHRTLNELYTAATHQPELLGLARLWPEGMVELLEPRIGRRAADAVTVFFDGAMLHSLITGTPLSIDALTDAITRL